MTKKLDDIKDDVLRETFTPRSKADMHLAVQALAAIIKIANDYGQREGGNAGSDALMILTAAHHVLGTGLARDAHMPMAHAQGCIAFGQALAAALMETGVVQTVDPGKVA